MVKKYRYDYTALRGVIRDSGYSLARLSDEIDMNSGMLGRKLNGHLQFTQNDIMSICTVLNVDPTNIGNLFFDEKVA